MTGPRFQETAPPKKKKQVYSERVMEHVAHVGKLHRRKVRAKERVFVAHRNEKLWAWATWDAQRPTREWQAAGPAERREIVARMMRAEAERVAESMGQQLYERPWSEMP